jgi:hypothetical protein
MANTIIIKNSPTTGNVPTTGELELGELAINTFDGKLFTKKDNGTESIIEIGGGSGSGDVVGPSSATDNAIARFDSTTGKIIQNSSATLSDNGQLVIKSTTVSTSWGESALVVEKPDGNLAQIGFHTPTSSTAGIVRFYGPTNLFELRLADDSGFGTWHNKSIASLNGNVSGGNEADLSTGFQNRLDYTFTAQEWMSGKIFVTANFFVQRENGGGIVFEGVIVVYDISSGSVVDTGNISFATHRGNDWGNDFYAPLNVSYSKDLDLVAGRQYRIELQLKKREAVGPYYPRGMSLNYQIS